MNQALTYLLAAACLLLITAAGHRTRTQSTHGLRVLLGGRCPEGVESEGRLLVIRPLADGRYFLNNQEATQAQVRQLLRPLLESRTERLVWIAADEHVLYGNVVFLISNLQHDTPHLYVAVATRSQIGPVDPAEIDRLHGRTPDGKLIGLMPCILARPDESS